MAGTGWWSWAVGLTTAVSGVAAAWADVLPPTETSGYPLALTERPLLLPSGGVEVGALLTLGLFDFDDETSWTLAAVPTVRTTVGTVELYGGASLHLTDDEDELQADRPRVQSVLIGARHGFSPDSALGVELAMRQPLDEPTTYRPAVGYRGKARLSPRAAIEAGAGLAYETTGETDFSSGFDLFVVEGQVAVQAQVAPSVGVQGRGRLLYARPQGDDDLFLPASFTNFDVGFGVVGALSPAIDLVAGVDIVLSTGDGAYKVVTFGLVARRVP
jgi:hypothetical protein